MTNDEQVELMGKEIDQLREILAAANQLMAAIGTDWEFVTELQHLRKLIHEYEEGL